MKKTFALLFLAAITLWGCQPKAEPESEPPDLDAAKTEVSAMTDAYFNAWKERDIEAMENLILSWGLYVGTDPKESWNGVEILGLWKEYFADTAATFGYKSMSREINVSPCGLTAIVVNQGTYEVWSPNIPVRQTFNAFKLGDDWKIGFISWAFVFKNEDVGKLNKALE